MIVSIIPIFSLVVSIVAICFACNANKIASDYSRVSLLSIWNPEQEKFRSADGIISNWEDTNNLKRDGIAPESYTDLIEALNALNPPNDIRKAYEDRWYAWRSLKEISDSYESYAPWLAELNLVLPVNPPLPTGLLVPISAISFEQITCIFAGLKAPLAYMIVDSYLHFPSEVYGPDSVYINTPHPINIKLPLKIFQTNSGFVFDLEYVEPTSGMSIIINKNEWDISNSTFNFQSDDRRLEVIGEDGIPIFQIAIDPDESTLYIGGHFLSDSGELIIALPEKLVSEHVIAEGMEWNPSIGLYIESLQYNPTPETIKAEMANIKPWFTYE